MMFWQRRSHSAESDDRAAADTEAAEALARQRRLAPEVRRLAHTLHSLLEDNHLSERIAALYSGD